MNQILKGNACRLFNMPQVWGNTKASGHFVQNEEPQLVLDELVKLLNRLRLHRKSLSGRKYPLPH